MNPTHSIRVLLLTILVAAPVSAEISHPLGRPDWHTGDYPGRDKVMWSVISRDLQTSFPRGGSPVKVGRFPQDQARIFDLSKLGVSGPVRLHAAQDDSVIIETGDGFIVVNQDGSLGKAEMMAVPPKEFQVASGTYKIENQRLMVRHETSYEPVNAFGRRGLPDQEVRDLAIDNNGRLLVATASGIGVLDSEGNWSHITGRRGGLPVNETTAISVSPGGKFLWVGTAVGAARRNPDGHWNYRMGPRWMHGDEVLDLAALSDGGAWILTEKSLTRLHARRITLREKAAEIDAVTRARHVRHGAVSECDFRDPNDLDSWYINDSDNDGLWTAIYLGAKCFEYAVTQSPEAKRIAKEHFDFLVRLETINGIPGYLSRSIRPNTFEKGGREHYAYGHDGEWHESTVEPGWQWKSDTSSDELCGHFFAFGVYYDLVAKGDPAEEKRVQNHVRLVMNKLIDDGFNMIDVDGHPTRWGVFEPRLLNGDLLWSDQIAFNAFGIITHLKQAIHICGDQRFKDAYRELIDKHGYGVKLMHAKEMIPNTDHAGVNHSDDEMAWLYYYHLLTYPEEDEHLRWMFKYSAVRSMRPEIPEKSPFFNFPFALEFPKWAHVADGVDTLKRWPIDLRNWRVRNSHRDDVSLDFRSEDRHGAVMLVQPADIDERSPARWNHNPYRADSGSPDGRSEHDGGEWLLPYWMGVHHGLIVEDDSLDEDYIAYIGPSSPSDPSKKAKTSAKTSSPSKSQ